MQNKFFSLILTTIFALVGISAQAQSVNAKPFTIPEVIAWSGAEGTFVPSRILVQKSNATSLAVAQQLAADYKALLNADLKVVTKGAPKSGDIVLTLTPAKKRSGKVAEDYTLDIRKGNAYLNATTKEGLFWGTRTLLQMAEQGALPCGVVKDAPQYALRGFMIDCGRKFIPMSFLRNLVKIMSYYKMNTLQVHLNDNGFRQYFDGDWNKTQAAFRLESDYFPGLTARDGHYTKQEFRDFQKYAATLGVEVIPEIDVPAHSLAFTHYRPSIASDKYGMDHLDLFKEETYTFCDSLFDEYLGGKDPVFCGKRVNIGTDEYSNADKDVVEKFRYFTDHYLRLVQSYGKQVCCWGALTHANGETPVTNDNVVMNIWYNPYAQPRDMKALGYQLVSIPDGFVYIVPAAGYYYDYLNCSWLYDSWTPAQIGGEKFDEQDPAILGGMFAVWNDHCGNGITTADIHHRVFPAMQTLSTKCWTASKTTIPYADFESQRTRLSEAPGVNELGVVADAYEKATVAAGEVLPIVEAGYGNSVSFTVEAAKEDKGTVLFSSHQAVFYLSDPQDGRLGFSREGYLNTFNYRLPEGEKVDIRIEMTARETRLYVNGQHRETLGQKVIYAVKEGDRTHYQDACPNEWQPVMYDPSAKMNYQRTLMFPLHQAGQFKSKVTNLKVVKL